MLFITVFAVYEHNSQAKQFSMKRKIFEMACNQISGSKIILKVFKWLLFGLSVGLRVCNSYRISVLIYSNFELLNFRRHLILFRFQHFIAYACICHTGLSEHFINSFASSPLSRVCGGFCFSFEGGQKKVRRNLSFVYEGNRNLNPNQ